jgi:DNA mismatch repair protein MutS
MMATVSHTPMIQQYLNIKEDYADAIVFFRLGDFYEMFFDDAILASKVLDITLTSRHKESNIPMCGVPYHASSLYIQKLIKHGYKVAIAEQTTLPGQGLVEREVTRVITPGTILDELILNSDQHNFISGIYVDELGYAVSYLDMSTGEGYIQTFQTLEEVISFLKKESIIEVVVEQDLQLPKELIVNKVAIPNHFQSTLNQNLLQHLKKAVYLCLFYVSKTQKHPIDHIKAFDYISKESLMYVDERCARHIEIFESPSGKTLFQTLNQSRTTMGQRYLKHLLKTPTKDLNDILKRQSIITNFFESNELDFLFTHLDRIHDIYRIVSRLAYNRATPKDMIQLKNSLIGVNQLKEHLEKHHQKVIDLGFKFSEFSPLIDLLDKAIKDDPNTMISEGGFIKEGYDSSLDQLYYKSEHHQSFLDTYLEEQKEITGIKQLKIGYQRIFGYYLEISHAQTKSIDPSFGFERKQTLKNAERYTTEVLRVHQKEFESLESATIEKEIELFEALRLDILTHYDDLLKASSYISQIDVFSTSAHFFKRNHYIKPSLHHTNETHIIEARHPVLEQYMNFVSNDIVFKEGEIALITGPNMGGKSTYMRMFAIIVLMAHIGFYVPAKKADMKLYDAIFTRIGASDDIASGLSTFMTEMHETNIALQKATKDSVLIFDEIGRGTSTYDGMALAQGIIEYIHHFVTSHTLFSTHYHELTSLDQSLNRLKNLHVKAKQTKQSMVFLYQVIPGKSDRSYGVQVASLAHLPESIIKRSTEILKSLEVQAKDTRVNLFTYDTKEVEDVYQPLLDALDSADINHMTPLEALKFIETLKALKKIGDAHD